MGKRRASEKRKNLPITDTQTLEELCINTIRFLSADAVQNANSGHPGMPMGAAAMAYTLWTKFLKFNPKDPQWFDRDRFVLSAGHGSMLLYSLLYLTGYDLPLEEIKRFRQWGSKTPGHPERGHTVGVEVSTGPLGQGFGNGVGMAIAEAWLACALQPRGPQHCRSLHLCDLRRRRPDGRNHARGGIARRSSEAGKLIYLYDQNHISLAGGTNLCFTEDVAKRFEAYGWHTRHVHEGNDTEDVAAAIEEARAEHRRPSLNSGADAYWLRKPEKTRYVRGAWEPAGRGRIAGREEGAGLGLRWISSICRKTR